MVGSLTGTQRLELQEYGKPVECDAVLIDLEALKAANTRWSRALRLGADPILVDELEDGRLRLRATMVAGVVRIGTTDLEIAPKFLNNSNASWQTVLWRILSIVEGGFVDSELTTAHQADTLSLPDLLAQMFLDSYARGAARGLPRAYATESASGPTLRGSLDTSRIGEWIARPWSVPHTADMLTDDTALSRLLRWAAETLSMMVQSPSRAMALREVSGGLAHVGRRPPHEAEVQRIALGTQHRALEPARLVGLLLLEGAGVHHAAGAHALSGFLWNSDAIYENFVFWLCQRAARRAGLAASKKEVKFGTLIAGPGSKLATSPDVVFRNAADQTVAVTDAKYKRFGSRPKSGDTYQILTAAHVLGCRKVSLSYPVDHDTDRSVWSVESGLGAAEIEMSALPLNLMSLAANGGVSHLVDVVQDWLISDLLTD